MQLRLYDTLTREKRPFVPLDPANVRMYVCGPTVYDFAHIGNARPVIVFDVLFRLLRHLYGDKHVTYVRNITDVDDKINDRAARDFPGLPLNEAIRKVTEKTAAQFHTDVKALGSLPPTFEPRATDFVEPRADGKADMVTLIRRLIERGNAYEAGGEVLFDTTSMPDYGMLSGRKLEEQLAGARVAVDAHKRNPADFVLWKQSSENEPGWDSPWGRGRPGWHIECSAMSAAYLGDIFDIHGGGLDLIFPHHENELAQSRCAHGTSVMANYWMHNGFLQVHGEKMSKSLGNFITIKDLLNTRRFGGRAWSGSAIRVAMLKTHYQSPIDWTVSALEEGTSSLQKWKNAVTGSPRDHDEVRPLDDVVEALSDNLNTVKAIQIIDRFSFGIYARRDKARLAASLELLGLFSTFRNKRATFRRALTQLLNAMDIFAAENAQGAAEDINHSTESDADLFMYGVLLALTKKRLSETGGKEVSSKLDSIVTKISPTVSASELMRMSKKIELISQRIDARNEAKFRRDFPESDRIRDELARMGVVLKDGKDADGNPVTTWEIAR